MSDNQGALKHRRFDLMHRSASPDLASLRALLIESDPTDARQFERGFRACGDATLEIASDVDIAVQRLDGRMVPDIIFLNLRLHGCPATEFAWWARHHEHFAPALLIALTDDLSQAALPPVHHGVHALLVKPVNARDLMALMLLAQARRAVRSNV